MIDSYYDAADADQELLECMDLFLSSLRYESSTLILYKELSSTIFQNCRSVSEVCVTPVQFSTLCNI